MFLRNLSVSPLQTEILNQVKPCFRDPVGTVHAIWTIWINLVTSEREDRTAVVAMKAGNAIGILVYRDHFD